MRRGGGRAKGSSFERKVAHLVISAFKKEGFTSKDCYRTPLSGGHRFSRQTDPGDLVVSPELRRRFPFVVECKHIRSFNLSRYLVASPKKSWHEWKFISQAFRQAYTKDFRTLGLWPLLVVRGNNTPIFTALPLKYRPNKTVMLAPSPLRRNSIRINAEGLTWVLVPWSRFISAWKSSGCSFQVKGE